MSCRCGRHNNDKENAPLAQLVEHLTLNQGVQGSSPWRCTRENRFWRHNFKTQKTLGCYPGAFCCQADCCYSSPSSHLHM